MDFDVDNFFMGMLSFGSILMAVKPTADTATGTATYESGPSFYNDFPQTDEPLCILGEQYSTRYDMEDLKHDILSRIWLTYRRNFAPIGGLGPSSDQGWGCMLRCGQMILAQALVLRHLGRGWRWNPVYPDETYRRILRLFQDKKSSVYSIHQIASMGESEGKNVGQWFGPNTVAQVLKKIAVYDDWSSLVIHVAMDNTVIEKDIRQVCKSRLSDNEEDCPKREESLRERNSSANSVGASQAGAAEAACNLDAWKPLLLIIPLRLGLTDINPVYFDSLKRCLALKSSVGIIGGKPNHAHWFIGFLGEELVYLDPHTTQPLVDLDTEEFQDESFHCPFPGRMRIAQLDPSVALGFYCGTEAEFDTLCQSFRTDILSPSKNPMFEVHQLRPKHWPSPIETSTGKHKPLTGFHVVQGAESIASSDDDFEII